MKHVIGYARLSSASEESTSIDRQREVIAATAKARGLELIEIIEDPAASASKLRLNRPGLTRVRQYLAAGRADAVLVWRLDRIARSVVDFGTLLDEGVNIVSCTEPLDTTTPMGRAMAEILQVFAAMEARAISARVASSVDYLRRNQRYPGGNLPYGYRPCPHPSGRGRALELDPTEAAIVQEMARRVLAGASLYSIAQDMNTRGVPARRSSEWTITSVRTLLVGDSILGRVRSRGELVTADDGLPAEVWPPIIPLADALALRQVLEPTPRTSATGQRRRASRLLSGLVVCASCGGALVAQRRKLPDGGVRIAYRCRARSGGNLCESPANIDADHTDAYVEREFLNLFGAWNVTEEVLSTPAIVGLAEVEEAIRLTTAAMTERDANIPELIDRLATLRTRRETLEAGPRVPEVTMVDTGRTFAEEWAAHDGDVSAQRALLRSAIQRVEISPNAGPKRWNADRIAIEWTR